MLFAETVAVYCENHTEHTYTVCGQNVECQYVKAGGNGLHKHGDNFILTVKSTFPKGVSGRDPFLQLQSLVTKKRGRERERETMLGSRSKTATPHSSSV
jgi:hypothetical protein